MRHERVQRRHVLLHGLAHPAGVVVVEPGERDPAEPRDDPAPEVELEVGVGEVREGVGGRGEQEAREAGDGGEDHGAPRRRAARVGHRGAADLGDGDDRGEPARGGRRLHQDGGRQPAAHGPDGVGDRGGRLGGGRSEERRRERV